ncbi:hypothetical protein [Streptomyces sp. NPDC005017]|uniref:hypothetical protein n=1 Tax=Streptomyces sp. NPDC005017 TaxID=3364706 RepID=UPI0036B62508
MPMRPRSPQPPGAPRWVAMFHRPSDGSWAVGAESPYRAPVLYAAGQMTQTLRARGDEAAVELWGPEGGEWRRFTAEVKTPPAPEAPEGDAEPLFHVKHVERMGDRRQQVLMAGLGSAGLYDLTAEDQSAVEALVDRLDEATLRRVAQWLALAGGR